MSEDPFEVLIMFAVNRYIWHSRKCEAIKKDIGNRDYGPTKIISDWLECWGTTVEDGYKAAKLCNGQPVMLVYRETEQFTGVRDRKIPILALPGTHFFMTDLFVASPGALPADRLHLTPENLKVRLDPDRRNLTVRLAVTAHDPHALLGAASYQAVIYSQEHPDAAPEALGVVVVHIQRCVEA